MKYDFDTILDRKGKDALAVDVIPIKGVVPDKGFSSIPMWVADMSFKTAPSVIKALNDRITHPNFGYYYLTDEYYESILNWQSKRNGITDITKENIGYENGVLGGLCSALLSLTEPGEAVLIHSPVYVGFVHTLECLGRKIVYSPLKPDNNGIWRMDYEHMDAAIKDNDIHFCIFCSPHNPCGRVWERKEIEKAMQVYADNDCIVFSDEIWSDLIMPGHKHIPTASISEDAKKRTVALYSPSKTFSIAGLIGSYHIIYDEGLKAKIRHQSQMSGYNSSSVLSMHALIGAYSNDGADWVQELIGVLHRNLMYVKDFMESRFYGVSMMMPEGTYMLFANCRKWCDLKGITVEELVKRGVRAGVIWQYGEAFVDTDCIRMNTALPFSLIKEAMYRLEKYVFV
ncbi:MAG: aminotransferase class I/II-fold pyridoxal phosphate-dependent enzyme [Christensenellaceae bacterium]|nr:aminotransferase class I/II-fold pyridoxal phosphate-dependent enzyme [Christensenellaceae bacterium]